MTPAQLDIALQGAFIYERTDGTRYASFDYKLADYGIPLIGRTGALTADHLAMTPDAVLAELNRARDTDGSPKGTDPKGLDGEAATAGAEGIAETGAIS